MPYQLYGKPYLTRQDLIRHLLNKGLIIGDPAYSEKFLSDISYYRFKIYLVPYLDSSTNVFANGTTFNNGVELYRFDEELRTILFSAISKLEIKLRTKIDHAVSSHTGNSFWYLDNALFIDEYKIDGLRAQIASSFQQSPAEFVTHFKQNYYNDVNHSYKQLPPFWVAAELMTFGNIQSIYKCIKKPLFTGSQNSNVLDTLAAEFGAKNLKELNNWMALIRDVRNRCAHHSRVWNSNYREPSTISSLFSPLHTPSHQNRLYHFIALLHRIDKSLNLNIDIKTALQKLFTKYPSADNKKNSAGFPNKWELDSYWI